ncbi:FadR family transcriptional regulator [Micrococcales bacterium 31B]|nr:FadR family transcriptional regulator [Micrococcales bacterium 31B]
MAAIVLHSAVHETLGQEIVDGVHAPRSVLTLDGLQTRFGVSRTVMREVMRALEAQRLIESRRRVGIIVRPAAEWKVYDPQVVAWHLKGVRANDMTRSLLQLRIAIEPTAALLVAQNPDVTVRRHIYELALELRRAAIASEVDHYRRTDLQFHLNILRHSGNPLFGGLDEITVVAVTLRQAPLTRSEGINVPMLDLHVEAGEAIHRGDHWSAYELVTHLMEEFKDVVNLNAT